MIKRIVTYLFFFSLFVLAAGYGLKQYPLLKVKSVTVTGTDKISAADLPVKVGDNLANVDLKSILNNLFRQEFVASAAARSDLYGNLSVTVTEKRPVCFVYLNRLFGITDRCELIPDDLGSEDQHLPIIRGAQVKDAVSFKLVDDPSLRAAVNLVQVMKEKFPRSYDTLSEIVVNEREMKAIFEPGSIVVNFGWGNVEDKIKQLESILESNKNPGLDIDLRMGELAVLKSRYSKDREVNNGI